MTLPVATASTSPSWARRFAGRLRGLLRLPPREIVTTLHAAAVLVFVESVIRWIPLPRLSRMLGIRLSLDPPPIDVQQFSADALTPRDRRELRCARRVADAWPLSKGPCLRRSLVAGHMLRRHDPAVRLGVSRARGDILAHAWLEIDERPLERIADMSVFSTTTGTAV
jgi:Transglutaminase-like superfamily